MESNRIRFLILAGLRIKRLPILKNPLKILIKNLPLLNPMQRDQKVVHDLFAKNRIPRISWMFVNVGPHPTS